MDLSGIDAMLSQLQATSSAAGGKAPETVAPGGDFASVLKQSIDQVNAAQQGSEKLAQSLETGASSTNLTEVMLSLQKANISFQEMVQVRNRLVTAYNDIMNMQV
ncbi:MAG: flagellar hook-basal body complex protein FliE [Burkholderiales bacterium]|nr:flagellar hook-basal body complex protein FliE [Burkholderiales bacterium]